MKTKISVIIPTLKREKELISSIKSILKQKFKSFELIVVDQTRQHEKQTEDFIKNLKSNKFHYFKVTPFSLPAARNFGIDKACGEIIIFIDDDVKIPADFIGQHFKTFENKQISAVAGRVIEKNSKISKELLRIRISDAFNIGGLNFLKSKFTLTGRGCNMSFRKEILKKIGGFDTNFIKSAYREESDLFYRLNKAGYKTFYNPKASLIHLVAPFGGSRVETKTPFDDYVYYRNETLFFLKNLPKIYYPYFLWKQFRTYVLKKEFIKHGLFFKRFFVFFKGIISGKIVYLFGPKQIRSNTI